MNRPQVFAVGSIMGARRPRLSLVYRTRLPVILLPPMPALTPVSGAANNSDSTGKIILDLPDLAVSEIRTYVPSSGPQFLIGDAGDLIRGPDSFNGGTYTGKIVQNNGQAVVETPITINATDLPVLTVTSPGAQTADATPIVAFFTTWRDHSVAGHPGTVTINGGTPVDVVTDANGKVSYEVTPPLAAGQDHSIVIALQIAGVQSAEVVVTVIAPEAQTTAYLNAVQAAGYTPDPTWAGQVDTLVKALKAGGSWDNYDILVPLAVPDKRATRDLKNPTRAIVENNAPTFTADRGFTGNGTNANLSFSPSYVPGSGAALLTQNDIHLGVYSLSAGANGNYHFGPATDGNIRVRARANTDSAVRVGAAAAISSLGAAAVPSHVVGIRRDNATQRLIRNGSPNASAAATSTALTAAGWTILRTNSADYSSAQIAFVHAGKAHTDAQALAEHNALKAYLQSRGAVA